MYTVFSELFVISTLCICALSCLALLSQPYQLFPFTFYSQIAFFHTGVSLLYPAYITQTLPPTFLSLDITIVLKSNGFRVIGAGLEVCILTRMAADPRQSYKPGMSPCHFLELDFRWGNPTESLFVCLRRHSSQYSDARRLAPEHGSSALHLTASHGEGDSDLYETKAKVAERENRESL